MGYFGKCASDYFNCIPCLVTILILGFYDPKKMIAIIKDATSKRSKLKSQAFENNAEFEFKFFKY